MSPPETKDSSSSVIPLFAILFLSIIIRSSIVQEELALIYLPSQIKFLAGVEKEPELNAHAYLVKIIGEKYPLAKRREWKMVPPASLTKLLTAVMAKEKLAEDEFIILSPKAKAVEEKRSRVPQEEKMLRDDWIKAAIIESANDAALALAEALGKKQGARSYEENMEIFKRLAAEKALEIGMQSFQIANPTGLDETRHLISAADLALLAEYIWYNHPDIWEMSRAVEATVRSITQQEYVFKNTNDLLKEFPAILGGKTGFTDNAKGTLLFLYPLKSGKIASVIILGSEDRFGDGRKIIQWLESNL